MRIQRGGRREEGVGCEELDVLVKQVEQEINYADRVRDWAEEMEAVKRGRRWLDQVIYAVCLETCV